MDRYLFINLSLFGLAIFLIYRLFAVWTTPMEEINPPPKKADSMKRRIEIHESKKDIGAYQVIAQKDLFRADRTESKSELTKSSPTPSLKLFGTMIMDNDKIAILEDPSSKKRRIYRRRDSIGGLIISEIEKDKVILLRGEEKIVVNLREIKTISLPTMPGTIPPSPTQKPTSISPKKPPMPAQQPVTPLPDVKDESPEVPSLPGLVP